MTDDTMNEDTDDGEDDQKTVIGVEYIDGRRVRFNANLARVNAEQGTLVLQRGSGSAIADAVASPEHVATLNWNYVKGYRRVDEPSEER